MRKAVCGLARFVRRQFPSIHSASQPAKALGWMPAMDETLIICSFQSDLLRLLLRYRIYFSFQSSFFSLASTASRLLSMHPISCPPAAGETLAEEHGAEMLSSSSGLFFLGVLFLFTTSQPANHLQ